MQEYFVCKLATGEEMDFNKKAKSVDLYTENVYVVYDEAGNMIGLIRDEYVIGFYKTNDKCKENE